MAQTAPAAPACALDRPDRDARLREWQSLRDHALVSESHTAAGSISVFRDDADVARRLEALIDAEHDCCSHLRFEVRHEAERITVAVTSSSEQQ